MARSFPIKKTPDGRALLNLGCGTRMSNEWNNLDFSPYAKLRHRPLLAKFLNMTWLLANYRYNTLQEIDPDIIVWDLRKGMPFPDNSFDAIYHSHFLEHLDREAAVNLLFACHHALKLGGVIRVVVPDLAAIIHRYNTAATDDAHDKAIEELFDQMVRKEHVGTSRQPRVVRTIENTIRGDAEKTGELHRWMYDARSLTRLLSQIGFKDIRSESPTMSRITDFAQFRLDADEDGKIHKPESIYVEGIKP